MPINKLPTLALESNAITADLIASGAITAADISDGEITAAKLHTTLDFSTKTFTMHNNHVTQAMVTQHQAALSLTQSQISDLSTTNLTEGTNLYYTDSRADARAQIKVDALVDAAPGTLDTLNELAAALGDDPNFATTVTNSIATKLPLAGGTLTGDLIINTSSNGILKLQEGGADKGYIGAGGGGLYIKNLAGDVIFRNSSDADTIRIKDSGNVGIGTTSPLSGFHISDGTNAGSPQNASRKATLMIDAGATASADLQFMVRNGYNSHIFFGDAADPNVGMLWYDHSTNHMNFSANTNHTMTIDDNGRVGIGTSDPNRKLVVYDSSAPYMAFQNSSTGTAAGDGLQIQMAGLHGYVFNYENGDLYLGAGGATRATIKSDGKFGIGTTQPDLTLHVDGTNGYPASSGSTPVGHIAIRAKNESSSHGAHIGVANASPWGTWIQAQDAGNLATNYPLLLNPNGGNVGIGQTNPDARLDLGTLNSATAGQDQTLQMGAFGFRHQDTSGFNHLYLERNYGGWQATPVLTARADGNVGINTGDPAEKLTVSGGNILVSNTSGLMLRAGNDFAGIGFNRNVETGAIYDSTIGAYQLHNVGGVFELQMYDSSGTFIDYPFYVAASSCVGIGHNAPTGKLDVKNNGSRHEVAIFRQDNASFNNDIKLDHTSRASDNTLVTKRSNGDLWLYQNNATSIRMYNQGSERAVFHYNGNTGIRSSNPQATLEVYGFIRAGKNSARLNASVHSYSSRHNTTRTPENLYNGYINYEEFNGLLGSDWLTASNQRDNAYVVLDLGDSKSINRAVIYNQNEYQDSKREVKRFILQGTNDVNNANSWVTVLDDVMGKSGAHEPNPGYSFRIPAGNQTSVKNDPVDDNEAVSYRYWKFIMKDFWASDAYGGLMEIELYEYAVSTDGRQDEISSNSMVATDVYAQTLAATGDINLIGQAQVNYNYHPVPSTMAPHSIPGLSSYLDMQHSYRYPRSGSGVDRYTLADLGNEPMSWTLRNENAANLSNSHMVNNITGVVDGRYSMKTGSNAAGGGVAATNQDRYHMMTYNGPVTFVWIVMRGNGGGINSNESLLTQNTNASSYGYQIIRHYPSYANIYSYNGQGQNISYPSGYSTAAASQKWYLIAHQYWDENQQSVTFFDNNYPNGNQQTSTANYDWRWNANANTRRLVLGGSEWGSYGESWGQGSSSTSQYGAIGAFMYYKNSLSTYDLKTIFDYYRNHYDMG